MPEVAEPVTNFDLTEEQQQIREAARAFAKEKLAPKAQELDDKNEFNYQAFKGLAELGFLGLTIPAEYGGSGFDTLSYAIVVEELSRVCASTGLGYAAHVSLGLTPVYLFGTEEQKRKYVPQLCKGIDDNMHRA